MDGEGCISIVRVPAGRQKGCIRDRYTLALKVTMGHRPTVEKLQEILGLGTVQNHVPRSSRVNASYSWVCQSRKAESVLQRIRPYLLTKAKEADVALEFMRLPLALTGGRGGNSVTSPSLMGKREKLYWKLRQLKPRWRFYSKRWKP